MEETEWGPLGLPDENGMYLTWEYHTDNITIELDAPDYSKFWILSCDGLLCTAKTSNVFRYSHTSHLKAKIWALETVKQICIDILKDVDV